MQIPLPIFPTDLKMINYRLGVKTENDMVYYMFYGQCIYTHAKDKISGYRHTIASLIEKDLCTITELSIALGIHRKNIERYAKSLKDHGVEYFFNREDNRGQCYRFTEDIRNTAQDLLDNGYSQYATAKKVGISESAIRYHLRAGNLKKKTKTITANQSQVSQKKGI